MEQKCNTNTLEKYMSVAKAIVCVFYECVYRAPRFIKIYAFTLFGIATEVFTVPLQVSVIITSKIVVHVHVHGLVVNTNKPVYAQRENVCENVAALLFLLMLEHAYKYNLVFAAYELLLPIHMQN
uniref:Uncharacterized protein n=1 Tax=Glossina austeni TaxID=7395 RepID=A0A1A9VYY3_GLOAU